MLNPAPSEPAGASPERPGLLRAPRLTAHQRHLLAVLGIANLIDNYDIAILSLALKQIQAGLSVSEADVGEMIAVVRLGVIPAMFLTLLADHIGRRRLLLLTIIGFTVCTFATAFVAAPWQFMLLQFCARAFVAGQSILALVVIAEELDARARGWGIGVLGALGTLGHGVAAIVLAFVDRLPFGWRALYVVGVVPLLLITWFRRELKETQRFEAHRQGRPPGESLLHPVRSLWHMYPGRLLALCGAVFPIALVLESSLTFVPKILQEVHAYTPGNVTALFLTMGVCAPLGNVLAGALGDRFGRKRVLVVSICVNALSVAAFYNSSGVSIVLAWGAMLITLTTVTVLFGALGTELFPTSYRSTASGVRAVLATGGAAFGFWLESQLYGPAGSHARAITWMLAITPIAPIVVALYLPETANQELEEISPERR